MLLPQTADTGVKVKDQVPSGLMVAGRFWMAEPPGPMAIVMNE